MTTPRRSGRRLLSSGDATIGLTRHPDHHDRMRPVMKFHDSDGRELVVELSAAEVRDLRGDADKLLNADAETVAGWWRKLADGSDGRPRAAT